MSWMSITGIKERSFLRDGSATSPRSIFCCSRRFKVWTVDWLSMVTFMWGYWSIKVFRYGSRMYLHRVLLTPIRRWPMSNSWIRRSSCSPRSRASKASLACSKRISPSLVSCTPRELRVNRESPRLSSSLPMALLMAGWLM